jgi:TonB family protein
MPQTAAASALLGKMKTTCESHKTGRTEAIQGVQAEEREETCSTEMSMPESMQKAGSALPGMSMKTVIHIWAASPGERTRVPALWQLSGFELWQKYFMNPAAAITKMMPGGDTSMMDEMQKDQSVLLRWSTEMSMDLHMPAVAGMPDQKTPLVKMTREVVELSTAPLDDSLFQIPDNYAAATFGDVMNGLTNARIEASKTAHPAEAAPPAVPANVTAYVPSLHPVSQTKPALPEQARADNIQGIVEVLVTVGPKGNVEDAEALSGPEPLRAAATDAVKRWTFPPVIRNGAPVSAYTDATVDFIDWKKGVQAGLQFMDHGTAAAERRAQLAQAFPRSPQQILADLEQDAGSDPARRYDLLPGLTKAALAAGADDKAVAYAKELLAAAEGDKKGWNYGNAIHDGHAVLGLVALHKDDVATARQQLLEAGKTPGSPQLNSFGPNVTLANELLQKGDRDAVLDYFTECRSFWKMGAEQLDAWSESVRKGETPAFGANLVF